MFAMYDTLAFSGITSETVKYFSDTNCGNKGNAISCSQCLGIYGNDGCSHDCLWKLDNNTWECTEKGIKTKLKTTALFVNIILIRI